MSIDGRGMFLTCKYRHRADVDQRRSVWWGHRLPVIDLRHGRSSAAVHLWSGQVRRNGVDQALGLEWATRGIRVNAVAPGTINTERVQRLPEEPGGPEYLETIKAAHPMGRLGVPSEVAEAILFLASDKASFITGAILPVDGGFLAQ